MIVGTEWLVDASGCDAAALRDAELIEKIFDRIIKELNLQVTGHTLWKSFPPPGGVTGLALLKESHLACHTYPEFGIATFNLYCCRTRPAWPWAERLCEMLGAQRVEVRVVVREATASEEASQSLETMMRAGGE